MAKRIEYAHPIDLANLPQGVYYLYVQDKENENKSMSQKVVKK